MFKLSLILIVGFVATLFPSAPASAACATAWGSTAEYSSAHPDAMITNARAGEHACFDRLVVVVDGGASGYEVRYVKKFVRGADGKVVDLRGDATLQITMLGARAHDDEGTPTYAPTRRRNMVDVSGFRTFRQAYWGGTFEGTTVVGVGVRARLPFRVLTVEGSGATTRLVVDVAHRW